MFVVFVACIFAGVSAMPLQDTGWGWGFPSTRPLAPQFTKEELLGGIQQFDGPGMRTFDQAADVAVSQGLARGAQAAEQNFWNGKDRDGDLQQFESTYGHAFSPGIESEKLQSQEEEEAEQQGGAQTLTTPELLQHQQEAEKENESRNGKGDDADDIEQPPENPYDPLLAKSTDPTDLDVESHMQIHHAVTSTTLPPAQHGHAAHTHATRLLESEQALISPANAARIEQRDAGSALDNNGFGMLGNAAKVAATGHSDSHETPPQFGGPSELQKEFLGDKAYATPSVAGVPLVGANLDLSTLNQPPTDWSANYNEDDIRVPVEEEDLDEVMDESRRLYRLGKQRMEHGTVGNTPDRDILESTGHERASPANLDLQNLLQKEDAIETLKEEQQINAQLGVETGVEGSTTKRDDYRRGIDAGHRLGYRIFKHGIRGGFDSGYKDGYSWALQTYTRAFKKGFDNSFEQGRSVAVSDKESSNQIDPSNPSAVAEPGISPQTAILKQEVDKEAAASQALDAQEQQRQEVMDSPQTQSTIDEEAASAISGSNDKNDLPPPGQTGPTGTIQDDDTTKYVDPVNGNDMYGGMT